MSAEHQPDVEQVTDDIDHVLSRSWFFDPQTINVRIVGGRVILTGTARSPRERRMAAAAAWAHEGVIEVENHLSIA